MNRIHEEKKFVTLVVPQSMSAGDTVEGDYKALTPNPLHDVLFNVTFGVLAQTKAVTVQVWQADNGSGDNPEELEDAETTFTAPTGGVTEGQILISLPVNAFTKEYATVKIINTAAAPVLGFAEMVIDQAVRGKNVNDQADAVTVL